MHKHQALDDWSRMGKKYLVVFLAVFLTVLMIPANLRAQAPDTEEDIIKKAAVHFENEDYPAAMPLYSQLLANHPKDPNYNYRFGVCMLYANADKGKALPFLEVASKDPKAEVEVWFYLGRAYHLNYRFDEAIRAYSKYKTLAGEKKAEKLQVDNQIAMCKTGKKLLKAVTDITVLEKKELPVGDFFRSYNLEGYSGQLLVKGDEFKTNLDRKKKETSIIFLSGEKNILYFSSYGDNEENGKDIYRVVRLPTGGWSKPYNVGYPINTEFDEDYPFLHPNGKVLYFSSKGHNSMGGYDIFRSELNEETGSWLKPENMDFAINSPDDDILFVTDMEEKTAWFASARNSPQGMMTVYHVVIERKPVNACLISGKFKPSGVDPSASSKITVRNEETNQPVGVYKSNDQTGAYLISLPNTGGKYTFTVEKSGIHTQTKTVFIPPQYEMKPVRQEIFYTESNGDQLLNVVTYFDEDSASFAPDFLKDKANLDVGDNSGQYEVVDLGNPNQRDPDDKADPDEDDDSIDVPDAGDPAANVPSSQNKVTTEELVTAAFENADETSKEATQLDQQTDRSYAYAQKLNEEAKAKQADADKAKADAASLPDGPDKVAAQQKAANLQAEANALQAQTVAAFNVAQALEQDAKQKEEEAKLAADYANSLQAASKSSDPKAMDAVAQKELALQNQSDVRPQGEELLKNIQESADKKRDQLQTAKSQAQDLRDEQKSNEDLITNLKADAAKEKDPDLKAGYESQIEGIEETMADNAAELKKADAKVVSLQNDVNELDNQVAAATNTINESKNPAVAPVPIKAEDKKALGENVVVYQQRVDDGGTGVAPVTQMPVVQNPTTQNPTTQNPTTQNPTTQNPVTQNPTTQNPVTQNPVTQNPVTQDPTTQNPVTQDPTTQNPTTQNPTTQNPTTQDPVTQNPVNETAIPPAADAITDVRNNVSEKIQEAEDISDPVRKEEIIGEAHREAEQALEQKIAATQQQLASETDPARKNELQKNIDQLTEEKDQQHRLAEESKQRSDNAIAATASNEQPADPFVEYTNAIAAADTISDPALKENKKAEAYTQWANALDQKTAEDKKAMSATKDKAEKDSLKQVIAADQKKSAELKQDAKEAKANEEKVIAQQNSPGAKSDRAFEDQVASLSKNPNVAERETAKEAVYSAWADSLNNEADKRDALAAKERNAGKKADLVAQAKDLRADADEKRNLAESSRLAAQEATVAQNPVVQNPTTQNPTTQTPGAVVEEGVTYSEADAKVALKERDDLNAEAKAFRANQDSLINVAGGKSGEEKTDLLAAASEAQRQAWNKEAEASAKQGEANQEQYTDNATTLQAYESAANGNTNPAVESAGLLNDESEVLLQRAKDKRAEAKLATSQYQRSEALSEAEDLEQQALVKQQQAIARYQEAGVQPAVVAQNPATQNPTTQNPVTQNPTTQNPVTQNPTTQSPDARITNPSTGQPYTPAQIEQIRATPEYENYTAIEKEAEGYDEEVVSLTREGDKYQQSADYNVQQAQDFSLKAADETDPEKKREYVEQSAYFNSEAKKDLAKRDSVNELASNAKAESRSKHNEADLFLNELDKKTYEDVKTVGDADLNKGASEPVVQTPTTQNPVTQNPTTQNPVTQNPTTQNPVTQNPTTQNPTTQNPTTQNPVTQNPVTQNPTTQNPVTQNPVTQNPTTQSADSRITNPATGQAYTPEQVEEIRSSPEYDNYVSVEKEAEGYDEEAVSLKRQADKYQQSADYNVAQAQDFSVKAADETDPEKKRALVEQAKYYNEEARNDMSKRDSVKELVSNAEMEADAKHSEAELYLADLDKKTGDDVKAVASADLNKSDSNPVTQNPITQNPVTQNPVTQNPVTQNPVTQNPVTQNPVTQNPVTQNPVTQNPTTQNPVTQTPVTQTPTSQNIIPGNTSRVASQLQPGEEFRITAQPNVAPIPVDPPVPSGIVYKVQIGAFRNPIPLDLFKGIQPVTAESAGSGITRYTAGLFTEFANADAAKNEIRAMGYPDAFVVAFKDGKRISVADARRNAGTQNPVTQTPVNQTPVNQIPVNQTPVNQTPVTQTPNTFEAPATDVKSVQGLFYTVQVGVYSRPVSSDRLYNLTGLFSERTANGYIRYASGKYDNANAAIAAKDNIVNIGIKDAFVTAYFDGQRISMDRAAQLEREGVKPAGNTQPENNQPATNQPVNNQPPTNQPVTNQQPNNEPANQVPGVTATKPSVPDTGLVFCVQLGAYREVVPVAMANRFLQFASRGVSIYKDANTGLTVYQVGTLNTYAEASQLRAEALSKGITDAFVVAWKDGKKISVEEALKIRPQ